MDHVHQYWLLLRPHAQCLQLKVDGPPGQTHLLVAKCGPQSDVRQQTRHGINSPAVDAGGINERVPRALTVANASVLLQLLKYGVLVGKVDCGLWNE